MILCDGSIVEKHQGNPSGSANTVVDNTLGLYWLLAYCFYLAWEEHVCALRASGSSVADVEDPDVLFHSCVEAILYGDDNTMSVSDRIVGWFNARVCAAIAARIGFRITAGNDQWDARPLAQACFLSQGFRYLPTHDAWVPIPEAEKIRCSLL
jgi:hypothetical protein